MTYDEYYKEIETKGMELIDDNFYCGYYNEDTSWGDVYDEMLVSDQVTGNGSGSYTFSRAEAKENVEDIMYDKGIMTSLDDLGVTYENVRDYIENEDYEALDVSIRCAILCEVSELKEYFDEKKQNL